MIICEFAELGKYRTQLAHLDSALACVEALRAEGFPTGRHAYDGGFLFVQRGRTKPVAGGRFEAHRDYIDVQYMIEGGEHALYAPLHTLAEATDYDRQNDIVFLTEKPDCRPSTLAVMPGMCYVAFPEDGHMPCRAIGAEQDYLKIVMKLPAGQEKEG